MSDERIYLSEVHLPITEIGGRNKGCLVNICSTLGPLKKSFKQQSANMGSIKPQCFSPCISVMLQLRFKRNTDAGPCYSDVQILIPSKYQDKLAPSPWAAWPLRQTLAAGRDPPTHPTTCLSQLRSLYRAESTDTHL